MGSFVDNLRSALETYNATPATAAGNGLKRIVGSSGNRASIDPSMVEALELPPMTIGNQGNAASQSEVDKNMTSWLKALGLWPSGLMSLDRFSGPSTAKNTDDIFNGITTFLNPVGTSINSATRGMMENELKKEGQRRTVEDWTDYKNNQIKETTGKSIGEWAREGKMFDDDGNIVDIDYDYYATVPDATLERVFGTMGAQAVKKEINNRKSKDSSGGFNSYIQRIGQ